MAFQKEAKIFSMLTYDRIRFSYYVRLIRPDRH